MLESIPAYDKDFVPAGLFLNRNLNKEAGFASNYFRDLKHFREFCEYLISKGAHWGDIYVAGIYKDHDGPGLDYADTLYVTFGEPLSGNALRAIVRKYSPDEYDEEIIDGVSYWRFWWD